MDFEILYIVVVCNGPTYDSFIQSKAKPKPSFP